MCTDLVFNHMALKEWCILCYIVFLTLAKVHISFVCKVLAKSYQSKSLLKFFSIEIKVEVITLFKNLMLILTLPAIHVFTMYIYM